MSSDGVVSIQNDAQGEFLMDHLVKFPNGRYDDGYDACAVFGRFYDRVWEYQEKEEEEVTEVPVQEGLVIEQ
ncbi:MAG: hypothetical protein GWO24_17330, partial [Akkermansiaceae bacterium]|nr:hypothetical protein [Akkermansiaceae bacterium]NIS21686.1 hypothetical protein [Thermoplasmata archaeon]NIW90543.1 hypothetical protein [Thermoplasmata archaeon]